MQWDAEDAAHRARHRDRTLRTYARGDLGRSTPFYRAALRQARVSPSTVRGLDDLRRLRPTTWDDLAADPAAFLVRPSRGDLARSGDRRMVLSLLTGRLTRRLAHVSRTVVEPRYKPALWLHQRGVPFAYTEADLALLARAGSRVLALAGLDRGDRMVGITEAGPEVAHWQLVLGAREAGVTALHLGPRPALADVVAASPTVVAGPPDSLLALLRSLGDGADRLDDLHTVLVTGADPDAGVRDALAVAGARVAAEPPGVVASWAPPGARAHWGECREGVGFHTFPDLEVVEVGRGGALHAAGEGELIWSALGWRGTTVFRLLTGAPAEVVDGTCDACERQGPMVITGTREGLDVVAALDRWDDITAYQVELSRRDGAEELLVFLAVRRGTDLPDLLDDVDADLGATQYVVLARRSLDARLAKSSARVVDTRVLH